MITKLHSKHYEDTKEKYEELHRNIKNDILTDFILGSEYKCKYWDHAFCDIAIKPKNILSLMMWFDVTDEAQVLFIGDDFKLKIYELIAVKIATEEVDAAKDIAFDLEYDRDFNNAV